MWEIIWWLFTTIAVPAAIAYGISYFLAPSAPKPNPPGDAHYNLPTAEESRPFPVVGGKMRIRGLNALSPPFNKDRTIMESEKYGNAMLHTISLHLGVCSPNIDGIKQIWFGETVVWPHDESPSIEVEDGYTHAHVDAENVWGGWGYGQGGGVDGTIYFQYGTDAQSLNTELSVKYGADQPAYRGFTGMILKHFYIGTQPVIRPISVVVKRTDKLTDDGSAMWYLAKANVGSMDDLNAIHWIYELLTSTTIGRGIDTALIGDSFYDAADTCYDEGGGVSFVWDWAADDIAAQIEELEKIVDGRLYFSWETQKYEFGLNRADYIPADLEEFGVDDFWMESAGYVSAGLIPNKVIVIWEDRRWNQKRVAYDDDIAVLARQNDQSCISERDYSNYVKNSTLANRIAARDQYAFSACPKRFTLRCLRTMAHLHETSVFKISYPALNITSMIVRVVNIDLGSLAESEIVMEVIEDVFGQAYTIYGTPPECEAAEDEPSDWLPGSSSTSGGDDSEIEDYCKVEITPYLVSSYDSVTAGDYSNAVEL